MCLAIPAQVLEIRPDRMGTVDVMGVKREVALDLVPRAEVGSYVLVHAGYGIEVVSEQYAQETLELLREFPQLIADDNPELLADYAAPVRE